MFKKNLLKASAATAALAGLVALGAPAAQADPSSFKTFATTGSDTTQDVWNALATSPLTNVGSYNAFGTTADIQTRSGGLFWTRPAGSGDGVKFLSAAYDPAGGTWPASSTAGGTKTAQAVPQTDVAFARSSSGPVAGTGLTYLPFARDAVSVAYKPTGALTGLDLSTSELKELYSGVNDTTNGSAVQVVSGVPSVNGVTVQPKIPQTNSGTRKFFLGAIGVTTLASYISDLALPAGNQENNGSVLSTAGDLIPFSAAQWIAQANGVTTNTTSGLELASINSSAAVSGTAPSLAPGALYGSFSTVPSTGVGVFNRDTYNVVPTAFLTGSTAQQDLVFRLTNNSALKPGLTSPGAQSTITSYGFGNLSYIGTTANWLPGAYQH